MGKLAAGHLPAHPEQEGDRSSGFPLLTRRDPRPCPLIHQQPLARIQTSFHKWGPADPYTSCATGSVTPSLLPPSPDSKAVGAGACPGRCGHAGGREGLGAELSFPLVAAGAAPCLCGQREAKSGAGALPKMVRARGAGLAAAQPSHAPKACLAPQRHRSVGWSYGEGTTWTHTAPLGKAEEAERKKPRQPMLNPLVLSHSPWLSAALPHATGPRLDVALVCPAHALTVPGSLQLPG